MALTYLFVYNGIKIVPASPPHKAILVFLGRRLEVVLNEGWCWLPLYPIIFNFILIKVEKVNYDLEPQEVRTPDNALLSVKVSITWIAGIKNRPDSYITYLNSGGEEGVKRIIHDIIEDRVKTWARSNKEGPSTWMEAQATKDDAHEVLVKAIMRESLIPINSPVPTSTWMRFFDIPQSEPTVYDANPKNGWAYKNPDTGEWNWDGLQSYYDGLTLEERERISAAIRERREIVRHIREGRGEVGDRSLGITIVMFVVNEIKVEGAVAQAADQEEKERREREADRVEIENISARAKKLMEEHSGLTSDEAFRLVQVERGKATRTIIDTSGAKTAVGSDLLGLAGVAKEIMAALKGSGNPSGNPSIDQKGNPGQQGGKNKKLSDMTEEEKEAAFRTGLTDEEKKRFGFK